jgi:hypothetical protein
VRVVSLTITGTNCYDCNALTCPCSENPPETRAQKPNNGDVRFLQKCVFRIYWSSEQPQRGARRKNPALPDQQGGANQESARSHRALREPIIGPAADNSRICDLRTVQPFVCIGSARNVQDCLGPGIATRLRARTAFGS